MDSKQPKNLFTEIMAGLFVLVFLYTAIMKFRDITAFTNAMEHSPLIQAYSTTLGWLIPALELLISLALIIPKTRIYGLIGGTVLMGLFTLYVGFILAGKGNLPCTCGGVIEQMGWEEHFVFNTSLMLGGIISLFIYYNIIAINRRSRKPVTE